jgi:hypothetical protein
MSTKVDQLEKRVAELEERLGHMAKVVSAVADDMLRACFMMEELSRAGLMPNPLPWELCSVMVELQHAMHAKQHGEQSDRPIEIIVHELQERIVAMRASLAKEGHG